MSNMTSLLVSRVKRSAVRQINETASICLQRIRKTKASLDYLNNTARHRFSKIPNVQQQLNFTAFRRGYMEF